MVEAKTTSLPQWYWEETNHIYMPYTSAANTAIETAYSSQASTVQISIGPYKYTIDLKNMLQENSKTKNLRKIRRISVRTPDPGFVWQFYHGKKLGLVEFSPSESEELERAYESKCESWNLLIKGKVYQVDFTTMTQTNLRSGAKRKVTRIPERKQTTAILCSLCLEKPQGVIFLPCGHLGCCKDCAKQLKKQVCPFCNTPYTSFTEVYQP